MSKHPVLAKDLIPSTSLTEMSWRQDQAWDDEKTVGKRLPFFPMILRCGIPDTDAPGGVHDHHLQPLIQVRSIAYSC